MQIRFYKDSDKIHIISLFDEFGSYLAHIDPLKRLRRMHGYGEYVTNINLKEVSENEGVFYVVEEEEKIIGFVVGLIKRQTKEDQLGTITSVTGKITELYIDALYREKGLGTQLMNKVEAYFRQKGCNISRVEVFVPNIPAHNLYKKLGYVDRDINMIKRL